MKVPQRISLLVTLIFLCLTSVAFSQGIGASLNGVITDPSGAAIPNARITLQNTGTNLTNTVQSNGSGFYLASPLPPGQYSISVEHNGFRREVQNGIILTIGQAATLNISLGVGSQTETVTVSANENQINSTTAEISSVIDEYSIKELPLNGRDPSSLVLLSPGMSNVLNAKAGANLLQATDSFPNESGASGNGGRQGSTYYLLDGVPNMDTYLLLAAPFPNADATQEFRVISNNFDAQYGFSPGAVVSIQTKAGTNAFHGGIFEFIRNDDLNATNWFSHVKNTLKRNQFGGYVGGPIIKNKLFAFLNYQGTIQDTAAATSLSNTPTTAMLNGDFSALAVTLKAPFATVNGKKNQINPAMYNQGSVQFATTALPLGQVASTGQVTFRGAPNKSRIYENTGRLDYVISDKQRLYMRSFFQYYDTPAGLTNGNILATVLASDGKYFNETVGHTWTISPTLVNVVSASWVRNYFSSGNSMNDSSGNAVCLSKYYNVADPPDGCYLEGPAVTSGFSGQFAEPNRNIRVTWWLSDSLTKVLGKHIFTGGLNLAHQWANTITDFPAEADLTFSGVYTGNGLADFLLGGVSTFEQGAFEDAVSSGWQLGAYFQDQYKIKPNLTLTAGLRWEPYLPPNELEGGSAFIPGQQSQRYPNAPTGIIFPGDTGLNSHLMPTSYGYYDPRLGIAWQPRSLPGTAFRAGFGLFAGPLAYDNYNSTGAIAPFSPTYIFSGTVAAPISMQNPWAAFTATGGKSPFPSFAQNVNVPASQAIFLTPFSLNAVFSPTFRPGTTQSWNASVEQQITGNIALHVAYVGSESYHQGTRIDVNPGIFANKNARTTYPLFGLIREEFSIGTASYHSLQIGLDKRISHGLQFHSSFTWEKGIDLQSLGNASFGAALGDPFNLSENRGISDLNVPIISVSNFIYTSPALKGHNSILRQVAGAWEISGIWTMQSGSPLGIVGGNGNGNSGSLQSGDRADVVPGQPFNIRQGTRPQWLKSYFNTAAFAINAPGTFGTSARNLLTTPPINTADLGLLKNWSIRDRYGVQFRWEMYNALNHPSFAGPNTTPGSAAFGQIAAIGQIPPRLMEGGLKVTF